MRARHEQDKEFSTWVAMDTLVQEAGRGFRAPDDLCEVVIVDDSWTWFYKQYSFMAPRWFRDRVVGTIDSLPEAPEVD